MPDRRYSAEEVDAAVAALADPERFAHAQEIVTHAAPGLQHVLNEALAEGGWFGGAHEAQLSQAASLEQEGKGRDAVKMYTQAARAGNGKAAKRLGEIYDKGLVGISRDYAESLKWYNFARTLGTCDVPVAKSR